MTINRDAGTPLHTQLTELLRGQIEHGELAPGQRLPSERELCDQYGLSRITVRQAMTQLANRGLIHKVVGRGTYVAERSMDERLQPLISFSEDMRRRGKTPSSRVISAQLIEADEELSARLQTMRGVQIIHLNRLRLADGEPMAIQQAWLPYEHCPGLLDHDLEGGSLYQILRNTYQLDLAHGDTHINAALARLDELQLLDLDAPAAVLIVQQTTYLGSGAPIEYSHTIFRADSYTLSITS